MTSPVNSPATSAPHALLFFPTRQEHYRQPLFSSREVFVGPDTETCITPDRTFAIQTPAASYDVAEILRFLPPEQTPDYVVVQADAAGRNLPRNLGQLRCPKILLVGSTPGDAPSLRTLIDYAKAEPFDHVVFDETRHHAHWFAAAGLKQLHWLPALTHGGLPRALRPAPTHPLTFIGQVGPEHPYRRAVLTEVRAAGLPLELFRAKPAERGELYADSQVSLNLSRNGELNHRVFEALAAGGFLLTDALTEQAGLSLLFKAGEHLDTWHTPGELVEKIRHYLDHPAEAQRIRAAGQAELLRAHHPDEKRREFHDLIFHGRSNPRYDLGLDARTRLVFGAGEKPLRDLGAYTALQDLHHAASQVSVYAPADALARLSRLADLPRLSFAPHAELAPRASSTQPPEIPVLWLEDDIPGLRALLARFTGAHILAPADLAPTLEEWGFTSPSGKEALRLFSRTDAAQQLNQLLAADARDTATVVLPALFATAGTAAECLTIAEYAGRLELGELYRSSLYRAVSLDRNCTSALLQLAGVCLESGDQVGTCLALEEAARLEPLPEAVEQLRRQLIEQTDGDDTLSSYAVITHRAPSPAAPTPRRILLVTNLFPPQELGGYGRMMWEFAHGLRQRGHEVRILTGQASYLDKDPTDDESEMEQHVARTLDLTGSWRHGRTQLEANAAKVAARTSSNAQKVLAAARKFNADLILAGNLDFLGVQLVQTALAAGFPVLHALANARPGYAPAEQPDSPLYWVAPCSNWNGQAYREAGYRAARVETLYPGARLDRFYRPFLPDAGQLRIAYASLVMPYKGAHVLVAALSRLHEAGIDFTAEIAGDTTNPKFVEELKVACVGAGMAHKVSFPGFLNRQELGALFARSNMLVFPSQFAEPFGISQVEALASGLVVVSSGTGGAAEIIRPGVDGLLFKADDDSALADQLHRLATQPELFAELQQRGQMRALSFSVDGAVNRIEFLAEELLAAKTRKVAVAV